VWIIFLAVGVLAGFEGIRRAHFEIFLYAHHIAYCILIPSVLWLAAASWEYLTPGLTAWFIDRCVRAYRSSKSMKIFSARLFIDNPDAAQSGGFAKKKLEYDADGIK
jgi:hypothetical protein